MMLLYRKHFAGFLYTPEIENGICEPDENEVLEVPSDL